MKDELGVRSQRCRRHCPWCRSGTETQAETKARGWFYTRAPEELTYLIVVSTEVLEVSEADVGQTDYDGDDQNHQSEH